MNQRNYRNEYARRNLRAQAHGFRNYGERRKALPSRADRLARIVQTMRDAGNDVLDLSKPDEVAFWQSLQNQA